MSDGFAGLGLRAPLLDAIGAAGFDAPTSIQRASIPMLRRGGNAFLTAGSGSGVTGAVVLALLDRLAALRASHATVDESSAGNGDAAATGASARVGEPAHAQPDDESAGSVRSRPGVVRPAALLVTATDERAAAVARTAALLAGASGVTVRAWTLDWSAGPDADLLVAPVASVTRAIRESALKLDELAALVIDGLDVILAVSDASVFETLMASVPSGAQRVVTAAANSGAIDRFVEAHCRRAITIPARPADTAALAPIEAQGTLAYMVVPAAGKPAALARLLRRPRSSAPRVELRSRAAAARMQEEMRLRGWRVDEPNADVRIGGPGEGRALIACDVPFDADGLAALDLEHGIVMVEAHELPHLRAIAAEAGITLEGVGGQRAGHGNIAAYRARVRKAIAEQDLGAQLALLGPLLDEYAPEEVAAALSGLLRRRIEESTAAAEAAPAAAGAPAFVRLYVSIGHRDGARPADIVGAITGEASISGDRVGRIEIRENFSVVEIAAEDAEKVIRALNGTTVKGRSLRVDYDRRPVQGRPAGTRRSRPGDPPRRPR